MNTPRTSITFSRIVPLAAFLCAAPFSHAQTNGTWNVNANGNWSATGSWLGGNIADGVGAIADFSQLNINSSTRTATIDTTSRTLGTILFGDNDSTHGYAIAASGGASLIFNNNSLGAQITQGAASGSNSISAPVLLADNLKLYNNHATSSLTVSGTISSSTAGSKTITNQGTGAGGVTLSGVISDGASSVAIIQDSATSQLTLSGANTFTGGVTIKQGTLAAGNNTAALGSGTVLLGDTTGSKDATLLLLNGLTYANAITVQAGSTGNTLSINAGALNKAVLSGPITLNNNLTFALTAPGGASGVSTTATLPYLTVSGDIGGTGNLTLNQTGGSITSNAGGQPQSSGYTFSGAITTTGSLTDASTGSGWKTISGNISNISSLNQNSANSMLILSGTNTYSGATNVNAGVLRSTSAGGLSVNSAINVASGGSLQINTSQTTTQTLTLSGQGTSHSEGALSGTNTATYAGAIVLAGDSTVADSLATTTLTLSGGITGSGRTLTTAGVGNVTISGVIGTGSGGLIKEGTGLLTLSAANTYTGVTTLNNGAISLTNTDALGGGGAITFDGGSLRHNSTNLVDYASRIVNSTGAVAIDTNGQSVTYAGNIDSSNTGGILKLGTGRLTLSGTNSFSGPISVNAGVLAVSATSALPSVGTGVIFLDGSGSLNTGGAYTTVQAWLDSDNIATASTGAIALTGNNAETIDFTGYDNLSLGASSTATYTGALTAANSTYRLGGGGATLTLSGTNALTGTNALAVSNGTVTLSAANNLTGATSVSSATLNLGAAGTLAGSAVTVGSGSTLAVTAATSGSAVTRASSLKLTGGTFTVTGNSTANSIDQLTGALTIGAGGNSTVTLTQSNAKNVRLTAGSLTREAGSTALIRGTNLGVNTLASQTASATNAQLTTPNLVGSTGANTTDGGILVGVVGDTTTGGNGFGATGGLLTHDSTYGVRLLGASEYKTSITDGQTQLDNVKLSQATAGTATTTLNADTTVNSLSLYTSGATGATIAVGGTGKLTLNSGVIYSNSVTATTASTVSNNLDFNGREGVVLVGGSNSLTLSGVLSNTAGNGLTIYAPNRTVTLSGSTANTYTGTTTVNGGTLALGKTAGTNSIIGDITINSGATVSHSTANQIADTANVSVDGGTFSFLSDTINNLTVTNNGSASAGSVAAALTVNGTATLSNGGTLTLGRSQNINGVYDSTSTLGALNITNRASGSYTAITLNHGVSYAQSGAKLVLGGDVTFTGNSTNTNTVLIDAIKGSGRQGVIELTAATPGNRTFNIANGAAATDLRITAALLDGAGGASGLVKTGAGTLSLSGANTYSGNTAISAGGLVLDKAGALTFYIGANGVNNSVSGTGAATFNGTFNFDLTNAAAVAGNSWTVVNTSTLAESFTGTFAVAGFTENANVWTFGNYSFSEATGILSYSAVPEPASFALLSGVSALLLVSLRRRRIAS